MPGATVKEKVYITPSTNRKFVFVFNRRNLQTNSSKVKYSLSTDFKAQRATYFD